MVPQIFSVKKQIGKHLKSKYLNNYFKENDYLTFSFVRHPFDRIVSAYLDKIGKYLKRVLNKKYGNYEFATFLNHVISGHHDKHWTKYYSRCSYCDLSYSVIGRAETFSEDTKYIFLKSNLTSDIPLELAGFKSHLTKKDRKLMHEPNGGPEARTLDYFKNVNQSVIQKLYEVYKIDFELFNYNLNGLID